MLPETCSLTPQITSSQVVSAPDASSLAAFVVPAGHVVQAFEYTYSFAPHVMEVSQLLPPYPASHDVQLHDSVTPPTVPPLMQ